MNEQNIADLIPKSLDDIIRKHRDEVSLRLASDSEIKAKKTDIIFDHEPRAIIDDWWLIAFDFHGRRTDLVLLGNRRDNGHAWITSVAQEIDLERNILRTENSMYGLGAQSCGEPPGHLLLTVCAALHKWGMGEMLGVLHVFY